MEGKLVWKKRKENYLPPSQKTAGVEKQTNKNPTWESEPCWWNVNGAELTHFSCLRRAARSAPIVQQWARTAQASGPPSLALQALPARRPAVSGVKGEAATLWSDAELQLPCGRLGGGRSPAESAGQGRLCLKTCACPRDIDPIIQTYATEYVCSIQSLSRAWLSVTPWTAAPQASLSIASSRSPLKLMSIKSAMPSNRLILCRPRLLLFSVFPFNPFQSESFSVSQLFASAGQSIAVSASASVLPMNTQDWSALGWTGWISLQSKGLSRVFSHTTVQQHQFFSAQLSLQSNSHIHTWPLEKP